MGFFKKAGRVAKNVAKKSILPDDSKKGDKKAKAESKEDIEAREREEYLRLKAKYDAKMQAEWEAYYENECDGECETCEYYDWCPDDFVDEHSDDEEDEFEEQDAEDLDEDEEEEEEEEPEPELTDEELAAKEAAEAYYEDGCDGECEGCEHYEWCPAEEEDEANPDDKVIFKGVTQGEMKQVAKGGVDLARETALAARDLKDAMDDIMGAFDLKSLTK